MAPHNEPLDSTTASDQSILRDLAKLTPAERLERAFAANRLALEMRAAGEQARRAASDA